MRGIFGWLIPLRLIAFGLFWLIGIPWMFVAPLAGVSEREYNRMPQ